MKQNIAEVKVDVGKSTINQICCNKQPDLLEYTVILMQFTLTQLLESADKNM